MVYFILRREEHTVRQKKRKDIYRNRKRKNALKTKSRLLSSQMEAHQNKESQRETATEKSRLTRSHAQHIVDSEFYFCFLFLYGHIGEHFDSPFFKFFHFSPVDIPIEFICFPFLRGIKVVVVTI